MVFKNLFSILVRMRIIILACLFFIPMALIAQDRFYGSWIGYMSSDKGNYEFSLNISEAERSAGDKKQCGSRNTFVARAMHNRNGKPEVIELEGVLYHDQSVYFNDVNDRWEMHKVGKSFSRLQFVLKFQGGKPILDGHWQEYEDIRKYRKGRLVLKKQSSKV